MKKQKMLAQIAMVIITMIWGITFVMVKDALNDAGPYMFAFLRFGLAFLVGSVFAYNKIPTIKFNEVLAGLVCGFVLFAGYAFQNYGLMQTTPSKSAFITSVSVIMVPVILFIFRINKVERRVWFSTALAVVGLYILLDPTGKGLNIGDILTFGCAFSFAVHVIFQDKYLSEKVDIVNFFLTQMFFITFFSFLAAIAFEGIQVHLTSRLYVAIIVTGVLATFISLLLMIWAQTILSANQTAILLSLEPVFAALFSTFFAAEILGFNGWLGGGVVVFAIISSNMKFSFKK
jgi:drug/metabolite transporter (DMT)-like permease